MLWGELERGEAELKMNMKMYQDKKEMQVDLSYLNLLLEYNSLMQLKHFLLEGMPKYLPTDKDLPFGYKADEQDCSVIDCNVGLKHVLLTLPD